MTDLRGLTNKLFLYSLVARADIPVIKFREIEVLWAVYRSESVKEAAKLLNVSQPAVSMMLKSAEDRFEFRLFNRVKGRLHPTPEAHHLFSYAKSLFLSFSEFERQVLQLRETRADSVSVGATLTLAIAILHPALAAFQEEHSAAHIAMRTTPTEQTTVMVAQRILDLGVVYGPVAASECEVEALGWTEIACLVRRDHPLAAKTRVTPTDLIGERVATYRPDSLMGTEMERVLHRAGVGIEALVQSTAFAAAQLAQRGSSVALVDRLTLSGLFPDLTARHFEPTIVTAVQLITPRLGAASPMARQFADKIREFCSGATLPGWQGAI